jgi:glycosyltransferase involved in cell wall biosynthesis
MSKPAMVMIGLIRFTSLIINRNPHIMDSAIPSIEPVDPAPMVSVIVPARNEEANLERCLRSLVVQRGVSFEILVVDDGSTDRTREIAESFTRVRECPFVGENPFFCGVRLFEASRPLPRGWTGKTNALVTGEAAARGEWLLFTDADTEHMEGSLASAVAEIQREKAALLSYSPEQHLTGLRQKLLMPLIFAELAITYSPRRVNDPGCPDAAANGQYILVRAAAHQRVGGFAEVATELLEDVALARLYKQKGYTIRFRLGRGLVGTRMYSSWQELEEGWTKNLALLFPDARRLARRRLLEFFVLLLLPAAAVIWTAMLVAAEHGASPVSGPRDWLLAAGGILLWLLALSRYALLYARVSRGHFSFWPSLLSVFGLPSFAALLRRSAAAHERGSVGWRGREYATSGASSKPSSAGGGAATPPDASNTKKH